MLVPQIADPKIPAGTILSAPGGVHWVSEEKGASPLHEIARVLSARGIAATVVDDAVVALMPRRQPTPDGGQHVTFLHCRIRSLAELGVLLGEDGAQVFWREALQELEAATAAAETRARNPHAAHVNVERLLPKFGTRSVTCGLVAFLLSASAWEDLMSIAPRAPLGTFSVALFFLWQAYRHPVAAPAGTAAVSGPARLYALGAATLFLVMLMLLGHSADGFLFGGSQKPVNTMVVFTIGVALLVFMRNGEQRIDPASAPPGGGLFGMPLRSGEAAFAVGGFVWLVVLALMPPHHPVFEHGFGPQQVVQTGTAAQGRRQ